MAYALAPFLLAALFIAVVLLTPEQPVPNAATLVTCRNPADGQDVVIVSPVQMNGQPARRVSDTNGAVFTEIAEPMGMATSYTWYALTDVDAPGYSVTVE